MKANPPITGHGLLLEGKVRFDWWENANIGGCRCGAKPRGFPKITQAEMQRWHRRHKERVRSRLPRSGTSE